MVQIVDEVYKRLKINVRLLINNRKVLAGIAETIGHPDKLVDITIALDKMDKIGADFLYSVSTLHDRLQANAHPIQLPIGAEDDFRGIIDLIKMKAEIYTNDLGTDILEEDIPAEYLEQAQEYREKLVDAVAETDEVLMMK